MTETQRETQRLNRMIPNKRCYVCGTQAVVWIGKRISENPVRIKATFYCEKHYNAELLRRQNLINKS